MPNNFPTVCKTKFTDHIRSMVARVSLSLCSAVYLGVVGKENKEVVYGLGKAAYGSEERSSSSSQPTYLSKALWPFCCVW